MSTSSADDHDKSASEVNSGAEQPVSTHQLSTSPPQPRPKILTRDEALEKLSSLPQLIFCGFMTVSQANSIRSILNSIIQAHDRQLGNRELPAEQSAFIAERLREFPEMANDLAGFLTPETLNRLMEGYGHE